MKCKKHKIEQCPICRIEPLKESDIAANKVGFRITKGFYNILRKIN